MVTVRNDSGETIPAFGIMRITGIVEVKGFAYFKVEKPNTYGGREGKYLVNGAQPIGTDGDEKYGNPQTGPVYSVYFDTSDTATPTFGELWGPVDGSWKARRYVPGFRFMGLREAGQNVMVAMLAPMQSIRVVPDSDIAKDASGTCSVHHGSGPLSYSDSTHNVTVSNPYADMTAGLNYRAVPTDDDDFEPIVGECV